MIAAAGSSLLLAPGAHARRMARARQDAFQAAGDGIIVLDEAGQILETRGAAAEALTAMALVAPNGARRLPGIVEVRLADPACSRLRVKASAKLFLEVWKSSGLSEATPGGLRGLLVRDITKQYQGERNLIRLAHYDSLTGLPNRRLFLEKIQSEIADATRTGTTAALLYVDLDHFKEINDTHGHSAGDMLLKQLAMRLVAGLVRGGPQGADASRVSVARLSGDEFAIVASRMADAEAARELARRVLVLIADPIRVAERSLTPSASIGIALFPKDGENVEALIHCADAAVYSAKSRGRNRLAFYEPAIDASMERIGRIAIGLRGAIQRSELTLHYQPKIDLATGTAVGLEALMRWKSPELGDVSPKDFIPVAEKRGLIGELGAWCLDEACQQIGRWRMEGFEPVRVSVNVSSAQFREGDVQRAVSNALTRNAVEPALLEIELTESLLLDGGEQTALCLRDLRAMGVTVALDDFGTGYSALTYLNLFPLDVLKMDRSFLREIHSNPSAAEIASAVVAMAHGLGLTVVAEGVDSLDQLAVLRTMTCDQVQGFLYAPAVSGEEARRFLARENETRPSVPFATSHPGRRNAETHAVARPANEPALELGGAAPAASRAAGEAPALLLVDDGNATLSGVTERLVRLARGVDLQYAAAPDEARVLLHDEQLAIRAVLAPPSIDLHALGEIRRTLTKRSGGEPSLLVAGDEPNPRLRARLRSLGVSAVLWSPFDDLELAFVLKSALAAREDLSRRREIRVPVDLTARMKSGKRREVAVLSSLSRRGAFIELSDPLAKGELIQLEFELGGTAFRFFAEVVHVETESSECPFPNSGNGVVFYGAERGTEHELVKAIGERASRYLP
jgi:diguanylate cyclase (GGDEF)-like protein